MGACRCRQEVQPARQHAHRVVQSEVSGRHLSLRTSEGPTAAVEEAWELTCLQSFSAV